MSKEEKITFWVVSLLLVAGIAMATAFGVSYPQPAALEPYTTRYGQYGSIEIVGNNNLKVGNGTPSTTLNGEDAYVEGTFEVDGAVDLDSTMSVAGTLTAAGTVSAEQLTTTDDATVTDDLTVSGASALNGGITADTDKFTVADATGNTSVAGTLGVGGTTTLSGLLIASSTEVTVTDGITVTPTTTLYILDAAGAVTITLAACTTDGTPLLTYGRDAVTITINDSNVRTNDGGVQALGQYDLISWICVDTEWVEISDSANS